MLLYHRHVPNGGIDADASDPDLISGMNIAMIKELLWNATSE